MGCKGEMCRKALSPRPRSLLILARRGRGGGQDNTYYNICDAGRRRREDLPRLGTRPLAAGHSFPRDGKGIRGSHGGTSERFPHDPFLPAKEGLASPSFGSSPGKRGGNRGGAAHEVRDGETFRFFLQGSRNFPPRAGESRPPAGGSGPENARYGIREQP